MFKNPPQKIWHRLETKHSTCNANKLMAFYPIGVSTEKIIERPRIQKWNSLRNTQVRFDSIRFYVNWTLASERCVKACRVTINLKYLTNQELKFSKPFNIWSSIHDNVKQHWHWNEKSVAYKKKRVMEKINCVKLFGVNVDYKLNCIVHLDGIVRKSRS